MKVMKNVNVDETRESTKNLKIFVMNWHCNFFRNNWVLQFWKKNFPFREIPEKIYGKKLIKNKISLSRSFFKLFWLLKPWIQIKMHKISQFFQRNRKWVRNSKKWKIKNQQSRILGTINWSDQNSVIFQRQNHCFKQKEII